MDESTHTPATCPAHGAARVVRNGTVVQAHVRLQKYLCQQPDGSRHSFTGPVPGVAAAVPAPGHPPRHRYAAESIARGLLAVARGATYRQARIAVLGAGSAAGTADGQLVARWVRSFGPVAAQRLAGGDGPRVVAARRHAVEGPGERWLLAVVDGASERPRVWPVSVERTVDEAAWRRLFADYRSRPDLVLCEEPDQRAAAVHRWGSPDAEFGTAGRTMLWFDSGGEGDEVVAHLLPTDPAGSDRTDRSVRAAEPLLRRLAVRAGAIRSCEQAHLIVNLMALEADGAVTVESLAAVVRDP